MTASYRMIDYSLRPAKFAERKMLSEIFSRLSVFSEVDLYQYVGFGSIWFSDCALFHKQLGIADIISIEKERNHEERFRFNIPYKGIQLLIGNSADKLLEIDWSRRSIVWLDYDDPVDRSILADIHTVCTRASSGTAIAISVQSEKLFDKREIHEEQLHIDTVEKFLDYFGEARTPADLSNADIRGWGISKTSRKLILNEIQSALSQINASRSPDNRMKFCKISSFEYADGAKMTTVVGILVNESQLEVVESGNFRRLSYFSETEEAFRIKVPMLTPREMRHLDKKLPISNGEALETGPIPSSDAKSYAELYRYLPNFASFEV